MQNVRSKNVLPLWNSLQKQLKSVITSITCTNTVIGSSVGVLLRGDVR